MSNATRTRPERAAGPLRARVDVAVLGRGQRCPRSARAIDTFLVALDAPDHLLLGEPAYTQGDPREPGELSLLQINWDEELGVVYGDAGRFSFWGSPEDLRMGR